MSDMKVTAIAPWFGSNRKLAENVGKVMGRQNWIGVPFAGGMCELPHLKARTIVANDLHRHVINMARVMADGELGPSLYRKLRRYVLHPDSVIIAQQRCELRDRNMQAACDLHGGVDRDRIRAGESVEPDLMWAEDYFVSCWFARSHSAGSKDEFSNGMSVRWNASGGDSAKRVQSAIRSLPAWRRALRATTFVTMDALEFLGKCKDEAGHGIYCDPPFPGPGDRYKHTIDEEYQGRLAECMAGLTAARVVMRFYDHPLIRKLYPESGWRWNRYVGRTQANKEAPEILLVNDAPKRAIVNAPAQSQSLFASEAA